LKKTPGQWKKSITFFKTISKTLVAGENFYLLNDREFNSWSAVFLISLNFKTSLSDEERASAAAGVVKLEIFFLIS